MTVTEWIFLGLGAFIVLSAAVSFVIMLRITMPIAKNVYKTMFTKDSPEKWGRKCSCPENPEHLRMFREGVEWAKANVERKSQVRIKSGELNLYGEFYDFGSKDTVIITAGRAESLMYGYYFAAPYKRCGLNVLVIDQRATGKSDGDKIGYGVWEAEDVRCWMAYLKEKLGQRGFVIHGICTGATTAVYLAAEGAVKAVVLEGPYKSFLEVLRRRTILGGHKPFPVIYEIKHIIKRNTGIDIVKYAPEKYVQKMTSPALFLCGKQDTSSLPENSQKLYERCASRVKRMVWFHEGAHSHLRIANPEKYDSAIHEFLKEIG